jgi:catechol 2,3-dioxygenase-like lactoylglutathione lyase family enzyme
MPSWENVPHRPFMLARGGVQFSKTVDMSKPAVRWVGLAIDCLDAGPVARFYERLLGYEVRDFAPPHWAQLFPQDGGVHLNIQGDGNYTPPVWPEQPNKQAKMLHFEVEVDDLEGAVATALEAGGTQAPWQPPDRDPTRIRIMLDPAGHPLCLFLRGE